MKELETKDSIERFEFKQEGDDEGVVTGILAGTGNVDLGDDVIEPGAFKRTLDAIKSAGRGLKMLVNHSVNQRGGIFPADSLKETNKGLVTTGGLINMETMAGREAFSDAKFGILDSFSIGFVPERVEFVSKSVGGVKRTIRRILEIRLMEASLVVFPMNPKARLTGTKSRWDGRLKEEGGLKPDFLNAIKSDTAALRKGLAAKMGDPGQRAHSLITDIKADMAKIKNLKGA